MALAKGVRAVGPITADGVHPIFDNTVEANSQYNRASSQPRARMTPLLIEVEGDLGGGTLTLVGSRETDPGPSDWSTIKDSTGAGQTFALENTYLITATRPHMAVQLAGATGPNLTVYVTPADPGDA